MLLGDVVELGEDVYVNYERGCVVTNYEWVGDVCGCGLTGVRASCARRQVVVIVEIEVVVIVVDVVVA